MKKEKLSVLKKKLDIEFSKFIRARDRGVCYTCGRQKDPKDMQAGHYISRSCLALRWDWDNVHCQCYSCNCMKHGDIITYREKLMEELGEEEVKQMESKRHTTVKMTADDYHCLIIKYRELCAEVKEFYEKEATK